MKKTAIFLVSLFLLTSCSVKKDSSKEVLAVVGGEKITLADLQTKYPDLEKQLVKIEENVFKYKEMYLNDMIDNKLVELESKKTGKSVQELMMQEVSSKITPVTDEEVVAFGKEKGVTKDQMDKFKDRIRQYLSSQREAEVKKGYANVLREKYKVSMKMKKPQGKVVKVKINDNDASKGSKSAKVTVVEFSEFQCPFCKRASTHSANIIKDYGDKVRYVFKHFPLSFHDRSHISSQASLCMKDQGKFFEYHDKLFENNTALSDDDLKKYATELGADMVKFNECLSSGKYKAQVDADLADGQKYGVSGAPTFFVNGVMVVGAVPYEDLKQTIDSAMNE